MKRNAGDFITGSQIFGHSAQMFVAGFKGPLILAALILCWLTWWEVSSALSDHQAYLIWMKFYAAFWAYMEFDPMKQITLQSGLGGTFQIAISRVPDFPPVVEAWGSFVTAIKHAAALVALIGGPLIGGFYWYSVRFGRQSKETKHQRGARLATKRDLAAEIKALNRKAQGKELVPLMGKRWRLARQGELDALGFHRPFELAGIPFPWRQEQAHTMLIGSTGMGKTVAMMNALDQIRARGHRAIVFDLTGAYISAYHDPARDIILHPLDARCPAWNIFDECSNVADFTNAAQALVPHDGGGQEQFWVLGARTIFVETCLSLYREGNTTNEALADELMRADLATLHERLQGTLAEPLTAPEAAKMAESVRAVFNVNAQALLYLPKTGTNFSIRDWVRDEARDGSILFVSARYVDLAICRQLLTLWLDIAVNTLMTQPITNELRLWFLLDELGALHRLPALENGLQTARNFGGAFITGVHTYSKLKETYGDNIATALSSVTKTKLILGSSDRESANWCSDIIGYGEIREMNEGYSFGINNARDAVSLSPDRREDRLVLPDQIRKLDPLDGYICFPGNLPTAFITLKPRKRPQIAAGFVPRPDLDLLRGEGARAGAKPSPRAKKGGAGAADQGGGSDGGKGGEPRQGSLTFPAQEVQGGRARNAAKGTGHADQMLLQDMPPQDSTAMAKGSEAGRSDAVRGPVLAADQSMIRGQNDPLSGSEKNESHEASPESASGNPPQVKGKPRSAKRSNARSQAMQRELGDPTDIEMSGPPDVGDFDIDI